jgi:hypothetical protein
MLACLKERLFLNAVCEFLDHRVGEDFTGNTLNLGPRSIGFKPIYQRQCEVFTLAHSGYIRKSDLAQGVLDSLALRIQDRCFQRDIDMRLHYHRL